MPRAVGMGQCADSGTARGSAGSQARSEGIASAPLGALGRSALGRLRSFVDGDQLFIMFRDRTNGRGTYGGGRFLHAPLPQGGATTLDFNRAFNPLCAVNDYVLGPVVPAENRLSVSVAAGEKHRASESH